MLRDELPTLSIDTDAGHTPKEHKTNATPTSPLSTPTRRKLRSRRTTSGDATPASFDLSTTLSASSSLTEPRDYTRLTGPGYLQMIQAIAQELGWEDIDIAEITTLNITSPSVHIRKLSKKQADQLLLMFTQDKNIPTCAHHAETNDYSVRILGEVVTDLSMKCIQEFLDGIPDIRNAFPRRDLFTIRGDGIHYEGPHAGNTMNWICNFLFDKDAVDSSLRTAPGNMSTFWITDYSAIFHRFDLVRGIIERGISESDTSHQSIQRKEHQTRLANLLYKEIEQTITKRQQQQARLAEQQARLAAQKAAIFRRIYAALLAGQSGCKKDTSAAFLHLSPTQLVQFAEKKSRQSGNGRTKEAWQLTIKYFNQETDFNNLSHSEQLVTAIYTAAFKASLFGRSQASGKTFYRSSSLTNYLSKQTQVTTEDSTNLKPGCFFKMQILKGQEKPNSRMQKICAALNATSR